MRFSFSEQKCARVMSMLALVTVGNVDADFP